MHHATINEMKEYITHNTLKTKKIAKILIKDILTRRKKSYATVLGLYGDLGSGKTNFAQTVAAELGVKETVPSPTFIIERIYKIKKSRFKHFIHIDAYRLKNESELRHIGWDEIIKNQNNLILVEWANNIEKTLPKDAIKIYFEHAGENTRRIRIMNQEL